MAIKTGREGMITERDLELMRALAFCPLLDARQIMRLDLPAPEYTNLQHLIQEAREHRASLPQRGFDSYERCRQTLYRLAGKGFLIKHKPSPSALTMWRLSPEGHRSVVHDRLWLENRYDIKLPYNNYEPDPTRLRHYKAVCEIFVSIQPLLTNLFGPLPAWEWMAERQAFESFSVGGKHRTYMPDAELILGDEDIVFVIEHQTRDAKKTDAEIRAKIENHHDRLTHDRELLKDQYQILFSCDEWRDINYAEQAGLTLGASVFAGHPNEVIQHIYERSHKLNDASPKKADFTETPHRQTYPQTPTEPVPAHQGIDDFDLESFQEAPF